MSSTNQDDDVHSSTVPARALGLPPGPSLAEMQSRGFDYRLYVMNQSQERKFLSHNRAMTAIQTADRNYQASEDKHQMAMARAMEATPSKNAPSTKNAASAKKANGTTKKGTTEGVETVDSELEEEEEYLPKDTAGEEPEEEVEGPRVPLTKKAKRELAAIKGVQFSNKKSKK